MANMPVQTESFAPAAHCNQLPMPEKNQPFQDRADGTQNNTNQNRVFTGQSDSIFLQSTFLYCGGEILKHED